MSSESNAHLWIERALALARESVEEGGGPFGAVIVRDGRELARGKNRVTLWNDPTAHAEIVAIREASKTLASFELRGCELYASCEPCPMCLAALHWARVDRVWFASGREVARAAGFDDERLYRELALPLTERALPIACITAPAAGHEFDLWHARPDRTPY